MVMRMLSEGDGGGLGQAIVIIIVMMIRTVSEGDDRGLGAPRPA